ncbi:MAG: DsbA family protein [Chloroflexota bacterium]
MDSETFPKCFSSCKDQVAVEKDVEKRTRMGVTNTPIFCANGQLLCGAQPFDDLMRVIYDELASQCR